MINVQSPKVNLIAVISSLLIIALILGFTGGLNIVSFQGNYEDSLLSSYALVSSQAISKIEYAVKYGKPLGDFFGIEEMLQEVLQELPTVKRVQVVLNDGTIAYNQDGAVEDSRVPVEFSAALDFSGRLSPASLSFVHGGEYHLFLPIRDRDGQWIGSLGISFPRNVVQSRINQYLEMLFYGLLVLILLAALLVVVFLAKVPFVTKDKRVMAKRLLIGLFIILGFTQLAFGWLNYQVFRDAYKEIAWENAELLTDIVQKDIELVLDKGVPYSQLHRLDEYLEGIVTAVPVIGNITFDYSPPGGKLSGRMVAGNYNAILKEDGVGDIGMLSAATNPDFLREKMQDIMLDMVTVLVVSLVLMVEVSILFVIFLKGQLRKEQLNRPKGKGTRDLTMVRPLAYILFFGIFMSSAFIPVLMKELYRPILGLPKDVVLGMPISAEMLFAGIAMIAAGYLIDKIGWRQVLLLGFGFLCVGFLLAANAWEPLLFIGARGIAGIGYGLSLMAMRSFANTSPTPEGKTVALSALFSGMYAGIINGSVIGAMFADRIGFSQVFYIALGTVLVAVFYTFVFLRTETTTPVLSASIPDQPKEIKLISFLGDKKVAFFFLLILIPTAICSMFLDYYFPLFAQSIGISTSNVGRAFMLNSLSIVYLGPMISRFAEKYLGHQKSIMAAGLIVAGVMIIFAIQGGLAVAFAAIILLGMADSFGLVAQNNYFTSLPAAQAMGMGKALGIYSNVKKVGQMLGPIVFGGIAFMGLTGFGLVGILLVLCILVFWLTKQKSHPSVTGVNKSI